MEELTVDELLDQAFERARDLDASLADRLKYFADAVRLAHPAYADATDRMVQRLTECGSGASAPQVGETFPDFVLPDFKGQLVALSQLLQNGPVAVSFHRGHWCPYCRINTAALSTAQSQVQPFGAQIVAITPDLCRFTTVMHEGNPGGYFPVLTDIDNGYALTLNLAIFIGREMQNVMTAAGWDISPYQGNDAWLFPIPATFVVGRDGRIAARYVDPDFRRRMSIEDIVSTLKTL